MKIIILLFCIFVFCADGNCANYSYKKMAHPHSEAAYQHAWCSLNNGIEEYQNKDFTRVDCLTETHAVEFDFANKWAESVGQALYYQFMTGKKAKVVLILENPKKQMMYFERVKNLSKIHNFEVEYVTDDILKLKKNKCPYIDCKCNKTN